MINVYIMYFAEPNKPAHVVCKMSDICMNALGCKAMCEGSGMSFYMNDCKGGRDVGCCIET